MSSKAIIVHFLIHRPTIDNKNTECPKAKNRTLNKCTTRKQLYKNMGPRRVKKKEKTSQGERSEKSSAGKRSTDKGRDLCEVLGLSACKRCLKKNFHVASKKKFFLPSPTTLFSILLKRRTDKGWDLREVLGLSKCKRSCKVKIYVASKKKNFLTRSKLTFFNFGKTMN